MNVFVDGGSKGNPGEMVIGTVFGEDTKEVEWVGFGTCNIAEYKAVIKALRIAKKRKIRELHIMSDSKLVVNQINGSWKINDETLICLAKEAIELLQYFSSCNLEWIPRNKNIADVSNERSKNVVK